MTDNKLVGDSIELIGRDARSNCGSHCLHCSRGNLSGRADALDFLCRIDVIADVVRGASRTNIFGPDDRVRDSSRGAHDARGKVS